MSAAAILIEDTHWPLVVVGVCCGPQLERSALRRARMRWRSPEPRAAVLVIPGTGERAITAHDRLLRWLRRQSAETAACRMVAWVVPDDGVRNTLAALLAAHGGRAFGGPSRTFRTVADAFHWVQNLASREGTAR